MNSDALNTLNTIVETTCLEHGDNKHYAALAEWQSMKEVYSEKFPQLQKDVEALQQQAQRVLESPESPLQYAVYLGHSPVDPKYLVVGVGGTRIEVLSAQDADIDIDQLALGQLVMLNKEQYIVAIRDEYIFGDTAEVINIIKGRVGNRYIEKMSRADSRVGRSILILTSSRPGRRMAGSIISCRLLAPMMTRFSRLSTPSISARNCGTIVVSISDERPVPRVRNMASISSKKMMTGV